MSADTEPEVDADATADSVPDRDAEPVLEVDGLRKHFDQTGGIVDRVLGAQELVRAVDGVDLEVYPGETLAVVGESGCGKSTLGQTLLNLHEPTDGTVRYRGDDVTGLSDREMRPYRKDLQMIFQDPLASLNPRKTVGEILTTPLEVHGVGDDDEERKRLAQEMLDRVGLKPGHFDRYPSQFSGGQQQRVGVARALMLEPEVIVADEPTSALDVSVQAQILNLMEELQDEFGLSLLFITHDLSVVRYIADRVAVMYLGEIVEVASTERLFADPQHPYTKSLLSAVPRIEADDRVEQVILEGTVPSPMDPPSGCRFHTRCPVVIPPEDWTGSQAAFREVFTFRQRVTGGDIEVDDVRDRLATESGSVDDASVVEHIVDRSFDGDVGSLPGDAADAVRSAAEALVADGDDEAAAVLDDALESPCETHVPARTVVDDVQTVACHRLDDDRPGDSGAL